MVNLIRSEWYTKSELVGTDKRRATYAEDSNGRKFLFIIIGGKYRNEEANKGLIVHPRWKKEVLQKKIKEFKQQGMHLMVSRGDNTSGARRYQYIGDTTHCENYDTERNIFFYL